MKRKRVQAILQDQAKRRKKLKLYITAIVLVTILTLSLFFIYTKKNKVQYVHYDEDSDIDYKVYLKENDFFKNSYVEKDNQYIATLIDYIQANFRYAMTLEDKKVDYKYSYHISAQVIVRDKTSKNALYSFEQELLPSKEASTSSKQLDISEKVKIDYQYYNDIIKNFVTSYNLDNAVSELKVSLFVDVVSSCEELEENAQNASVMSLTLPLTEKTMAIDISDDLVNNQDNIMICERPSAYNVLYLLTGLITLATDIVLLVYTIRFEIKTRSAENIYDRELKKILNNYRSYIQKINNDFDLTGYQALKVDSFNDLLEIRDTTQQPILMIESNGKKGTYFIIPTSTKILYMYGLRVSEIQKQMDQRI